MEIMKFKLPIYVGGCAKAGNPFIWNYYISQASNFYFTVCLFLNKKFWEELIHNFPYISSLFEVTEPNLM
jgi:hypothetical protein